jgi:hypothetical protein
MSLGSYFLLLDLEEGTLALPFPNLSQEDFAYFFLDGFPARNVRTDAELRLSFFVFGGAVVTMSMPGPGPGLAGLAGPPGQPGGIAGIPIGMPPGRRPGGAIPGRPFGGGGMGMPWPCLPPMAPGIRGPTGGDFSIGHIVIVMLQSGSTTLSQTEGRMISPLGPIKS